MIFPPQKGEYNYFDQWFLLEADLDISAFIIQEEEVAAIKWFSPRELKEQLEKTPERFLKGMPQCVEMFISGH